MLTIKPMTAEHLDAVLTIEQESFSAPWSREAFLTGMERDDLRFFSGFCGGELVAFLSVSVDSYSGVYIMNIAVSGKHRRKGYATDLLELCYDVATEAGTDVVFLEVRCTNFSAISLYEKHGFTIVGIRRDLYTNPVEDGYVMLKKL